MRHFNDLNTTLFHVFLHYQTLEFTTTTYYHTKYTQFETFQAEIVASKAFV